MLNVSTKIKTNVPVSEEVRAAQRKRMVDSMDKGFAVGIDETPVGATGALQQSAYEPTWDGDTLHFGWREDYAQAVNDGSRPHWIPMSAMPGLKKWARRVLGDEGAAWAVRQKIAEVGTEAQPFADDAREAAARKYGSTSLEEYLDRRL
jgi:hypothetical protein